MLGQELVREMITRRERGDGVKQIARELGVDRKTVKRWLGLGGWQPRRQQRRRRQLDRFAEFIERRANAQDDGGVIAIDSGGNAYVTGEPDSTNFPTTAGAFQTTNGGFFDVFVTKLDPTGAILVYSTFIGGDRNDSGESIAIDSLGDAYVATHTDSDNYPTTSGAFQTALKGAFDIGVTKLGPTAIEKR